MRQLSATLACAGILLAFVSIVGADDTRPYDYCVVGAGPAGLQMGYYLEQKLRTLQQTSPGTPFSYIVLEKGLVAGAFFTHYPRHRELISINKRFTGKNDVEYNLRHDWNSILSDYEAMYPDTHTDGQCTSEAASACESPFVRRSPQNSPLFTSFSRLFYPQADELVSYLGTYAETHGINVRYNTSVTSIRRTVPQSTEDEKRAQIERVVAQQDAVAEVYRAARRLQHKRHSHLSAHGGGKKGYKSKKRRSLEEEDDEDEMEDGAALPPDDANHVFRVRDDGGWYQLEAQDGFLFRCKYLLMATGIPTLIKPDFKGVEHTESYSEFKTNPESFTNQSVLILGKGNSAFETASSLLTHATHIHVSGRSQLRFAWQTHYVGDLRAINDDLIDVYQLKSLGGVLDVELNAKTVELVRDSPTGKLELRRVLQPGQVDADRVDHERRRYLYDRVINCLGFKFDSTPFLKGTLQLDSRSNGKYPAQSNSFESLSSEYPNLYFLGTLQHVRDWKKSSGGFIHGFRYSVRTAFQMLQARNHGIPWPAETLPATLNKPMDISNHEGLGELGVHLAQFLLHRANTESAIYQLFGRSSEIVVIKGEDETNQNLTMEYLRDVPTDYIFSGDMRLRYGSSVRAIIVLTLEFNPCFSNMHSDVFSPKRAVADLTRADESNFLHPVLRFYRMPVPSSFDFHTSHAHSIHHVLEDVTTVFDLPMMHVDPLKVWIQKTIMNHFLKPSGFPFPPTESLDPLSCSVDALNRRVRTLNEEEKVELQEKIAIQTGSTPSSKENSRSEATFASDHDEEMEKDEL